MFPNQLICNQNSAERTFKFVIKTMLKEPLTM